MIAHGTNFQRAKPFQNNCIQLGMLFAFRIDGRKHINCLQY